MVGVRRVKIKKLNSKINSDGDILKMYDSDLLKHEDKSQVVLTINKGYNEEVSLSEVIKIINRTKRYYRKMTEKIGSEIVKNPNLIKDFKLSKGKDIPELLRQYKFNKKKYVAISEINLTKTYSGSFNFEMTVNMAWFVASHLFVVAGALEAVSRIYDTLFPEEKNKLKHDFVNITQNTNINNIHITINDAANVKSVVVVVINNNN